MNKFVDLPSKINWGNCNIECAWHRYKNEINKAGYIEQYPHRPGTVIYEIQRNVPEYTDWGFLDGEIRSSNDEEDIFVSEAPTHRVDDRPLALGQYRELHYKWSVFFFEIG